MFSALSKLTWRVRVKSVQVSLVIAAVLAAADCATAQRPQGYQPARPTVSPYINLLRRNNSVVPNYYSFVRPMQRQAAVNQQQIEFQINQNAAIRQLQSDLLRTQPAGPVSGSSSWFQNPGTRSTFLNTSQYFSRVGGR